MCTRFMFSSGPEGEWNLGHGQIKVLHSFPMINQMLFLKTVDLWSLMPTANIPSLTVVDAGGGIHIQFISSPFCGALVVCLLQGGLTAECSISEQYSLCGLVYDSSSSLLPEFYISHLFPILRCSKL